MPDTFGDLIDQTIGTLNGFTTDLPVYGTVTTDIGPTDTSFTVDFGSGPDNPRPNTRSGLVEVGSELMLVTQFNPSSNTAVLAPWGRAQRGTTAGFHPAGSRLTVSPRYPRKMVGDALNQVVASSSPPLFAVADVDPITVGATPEKSYPLPSDAVRILRMTAVKDGVDELVHPRWWRLDRSAAGVAVELDRYLCHSTVQITVAVAPGVTASDGDDFTTTTGLHVGCRDLAVDGAIARLIMAPENARQQMRSADATSRGQFIQSGSAATVSKYYQARYLQRLEAEARRLQEAFPLKLLRRS